MILAALVTAVLAQGQQVAQTEIAVLGVKGRGVAFNALQDDLNNRRAPLNRCYQDRLFSEPGASGTMRLAFAIDLHGRASEIVADAPTLRFLDACVVPLVRTWAFPFKPPTVVKVETEIRFSVAAPKRPVVIDTPGPVPDAFRGMNTELFIRGKLDLELEKVSSGEVDMAMLERYVRSRRAALLGCYEKQLRNQPALQGSIPVHFTLTPLGRPTGITAESEVMKPVGTCLALMIRGWVFPFRPTADTHVSMVLRFETL